MDIIPALRRCLLPVFVVIYLVSSIYLMLPFAVGVVGSGYTGLDSSPYGVESRPVVYRVLIPAISRAVHTAIPSAIEQPATEAMIRWRDSEEGKQAVKDWFIRKPPLADHQIFETAVVAAVAYVTLLMFIAMFYMLTITLLPQSRAYALFAPLIALQTIPAMTVENGYIYDFAELFFTCALLYFLFKQRWSSYLICFLFATLNKETSVFTIFFFTLWFWQRLPHRQFINLLVAQCVIYIAIKAGVTLYFADKPGVVVQHHFSEQIDYVVAHMGTVILLILTTLVSISYRWLEKPAFLSGSLWMLFPNLVAYILICVPGEYRDFYWVLPVLIIHTTYALIAFAGFADHPLFSAQQNSGTK